jgi:hypothetical protein
MPLPAELRPPLSGPRARPVHDPLSGRGTRARVSGVGDLCLSDPHGQLVRYAPMEEWLVRIKSEAERVGAGVAWLDLVDHLVYAGNTTLAAHSR